MLRIHICFINDLMIVRDVTSDGSRAILTRTNAKAITLFCANADAQLVGAKELLSTVKSLDSLMHGRGPSGAFALFPTYTDLLECINTPDGSDLRPLIDLVQRMGADEVMSRLERAAVTTNSRNTLTISTVHKAKGREWDHVEVESEWRIAKNRVRKDEMRLMYVALSRGRCRVDASAVEEWMRSCEDIVRTGDPATDEDDYDDADEFASSLALAVIESAKTAFEGDYTAKRRQSDCAVHRSDW